MEDHDQAFEQGQIETNVSAAESGNEGNSGNVDQSAEPSSMLEAIESGLKESEGQETDANGERARDAAGRFVKKEEDSAKLKSQEQAKTVDKPGGEDDLSMPDGLAVKAQERFKKLTGRLEETHAALQSAHSDIEQFREIVRESKATPQEFAQAVDYMRMVKTGDLESALRILEDQRRQISLALGRPLPGADPLSAFPDLRQRVDAYQMDEQAALEIARFRMLQQQQQQMQQEQNQGMQRQQAIQQERAQAIGMIYKLGAHWAQTDPDYAAKEDIILKQLPEIARNFPASVWPQQVKILYDTLSSMPVQAPVRNVTPAPLRASGQSAGARQPTSMLEALQSGLGYANG